MAKSGSFFNSSCSDHIKSNCDSLEKFYSKCKKNKSAAKSLIPFDDALWTSFTITMICSLLTSMELYDYLVEIGFIVNTVSSVCVHCSGLLTLVTIRNYAYSMN